MAELKDFPKHGEFKTCPNCGKTIIPVWLHDRALANGTRLWQWWCGNCGYTEGEYGVEPNLVKLHAADRKAFEEVNPPKRYQFRVRHSTTRYPTGFVLGDSHEITIDIRNEDIQDVINQLEKNSRKTKNGTETRVVLLGHLWFPDGLEHDDEIELD